MILPPNTPNQIKLQDFEGDQLWVDSFTQGEVVFSIKMHHGARKIQQAADDTRRAAYDAAYAAKTNTEE